MPYANQAERRAKQQEMQRRVRAKRRADGVCLRCKNKALPGKTLCADHSAKENARTLDRYHALVLEGMCPLCGDALPEGYAFKAHHQCRMLRAQQRQERRRRSCAKTL